MPPRLAAALAAILTLVLTPLLAPPAPAAPAVTERDAQRDLALTVYQNDLGVVRDTREVRLGGGVVSLEFRDVPSGIDPTSVVLRSVPDPAAVSILEQRYAFDTLTPESLLAHFVGRDVQLRMDGALVRARLLGVAGGPVYEIDGKVYVRPDATPVLPFLPENLVGRPTLLFRLDSRDPGPRRLEATYLTSGLSWQAAYTLVLDRDATRGALTGFASVTNRSGATYRDAALALVAGDPNRATRPPVPVGTARERLASAPAADVAREEAFAEYHLYRVDGPITLAESETTQIRLVEAPRISVARRLVYEGSQGIWQPRTVPGARDPGFREGPVSTVLEIENREATGLGRPLPGGTVRVLAPDASGTLRLAGEDLIGHTPTGERRVLRVGAAFDLVAARRQVEWTRVDDRTNEVEWEIRLRNRSGADETVRVIESVPGDWRLLRSSLPGQKVDATTIRFDVPVPAGGETTLVYRVRSRW